MSEKVTFKYFEGRDVDQFTFYRIPKQLFTVSYFKSLSSDAKILYGLMLDRISLSVKNHWFDEQNRAYIYFSIDDVMELLGCGRNKAVKCLKELDVDTGIGLTQKRRQGFGKSNMIYVKTFLVESQAEIRTDDLEKTNMNICQNLFRETGEGFKDVGEQTSVTGLGYTGLVDISGKKADGSIETTLDEQINRKNSMDYAGKVPDLDLEGIIGRPEVETKKFDKQTNGKSVPDTEVLNANFKKFTKQTSKSPENKPLEVCFQDPNKNKYNKTEYSDLKSYRIVSEDVSSDDDLQEDRGQNDKIRYDGDRDTIFNRYRKERSQGQNQAIGELYAQIRKNIGLEDLLAARKMDKDLIMEIYSLIIEMMSCRSEEIIIASSRYPSEIVRSRFSKIRYDHIIYVIDCLEKNTSKVNNIRKYHLAALFNAPATMDSYYRAEVRHDMPYFACGSSS